MTDKTISPIWHFEIEDLRLEVVLDRGFWGKNRLSTHMHAHSYYELLLCPFGSHSIELADGKQLPLDQSIAYLIPPEVYHRSTGEPGGKRLGIRFCCTQLPIQGSVYCAFIDAMASCTHPIPIDRPEELLRLTDHLQDALQNQGLAQMTYARVLLQELMILLLRSLCSSAQAPRKDPQPGKEATARRLLLDEYLFTHYQEPITQEDLAREMHLSKRQLSRILQQLYGTSFRQRLIEIRLSNAARLLTVTDLSGEEIAAQVGYTSVSGFYEAFRKRFGVSVGKYRTRLFQ